MVVLKFQHVPIDTSPFLTAGQLASNLWLVQTNIKGFPMKQCPICPPLAFDKKVGIGLFPWMVGRINEWMKLNEVDLDTMQVVVACNQQLYILVCLRNTPASISPSHSEHGEFMV